MARLLGIDLDRDTSEVVSAASGDVELALVQHLADRGLRELPALDVEAIVIGTSRDPVRLARRAHLAQPNVPVLIVATSAACGEIKQTLQLSPVGGRFVQCVENDDRAQLRERIAALIFSNLLTNAAKYTEPGGEVRISASLDGDRIVVRVRDTGRGIAAELLPHIFDPFVQERQAIDRPVGGLGLGLAIVRSLTTLHGGQVRVQSSVGIGSEFTVELPAATSSQDAHGVQARNAVAAPTAGRVLIVDDNEDAAEILRESLAIVGFTVRVPHDGPEALTEARRFPSDVVLMDIGLPVIDGYELARQLRAIPGFERVPFVAVSGYGQPHDRAKSAAHGFFDHLVKPVDILTLRSVIARALADR